MAAWQIYDLSRDLKATNSVAEKLKILTSPRHDVFFEASTKDPGESWTSAHQSGLFELLLRDLAEIKGEPVKQFSNITLWGGSLTKILPQTMLCSFFIVAGEAAQLCLTYGIHSKIHPAQRRLIVEQIPVVFRRSVTTIQKLVGTADPTLNDEIFKLRDSVVILMGQSFCATEYDAAL